jgi:hypothetical protein
MRPIRSHLTYSNVMVTILAFIVLTGGTAVALNGTNTVQSDDLGPGSQVKAPDVAANAVNGSDVVDNSLTGADVNEATLGKVPNADKLDGLNSTRFIRGRTLDANLAQGSGIKQIASVGPYQISGECVDVSGSTVLNIYAKGPAGLTETIYTIVRNDTPGGGNHSRADTLSANANTLVFSDGTVTGQGYSRFGGTTVLRSSSGAIVQVDFSALAWADAAACHVWGTATTGTE